MIHNHPKVMIKMYRNFERTYKEREHEYNRKKLMRILIPSVIIGLLIIDFVFSLGLSYLFVTLGLAYAFKKLYDKVSRIHTSDSNLFGMKLLSLLTMGFGLVLAVSGCVSFSLALAFNSYISSIIPLVFIESGLGFMILGAYMEFRFKRHSGMIIYRS